MIDSTLKTLALASCLAMAAAGAGAAPPAAGIAAVSSQQQGMRQWQVTGGKLILVTGTYQDVTTYKRSLTFYLESKPGEAWMHVPVVTSETEQDLTWFNISQGEQTIADAVVVPRAGTVELVIAETRPGGRAPVAVRRYRLAGYGDDNPDGPAHYFRKTSSSTYPAGAGVTVEQVLKKEAASKSQQ